MTKKHAPQYFICKLNFKSHNFQTESPFKHVSPTYKGSTTLRFFSPCYALCSGHFEFQTLLTFGSVFSKRPKFFCTRPSNWSYVWNQHKQVFLGPKNFPIYESSSHHSSSWVHTSSAKVFFQESPAWYQTVVARQNEYLPQVS